MRILVVAATGREIGHLGTALRCRTSTEHTVVSSVYRGHDVDIFITSVGMVATAAWTSRLLTQTPYSLALNFGLCGTFDRSLALGSVVHVAGDRFAELGAEDDDRFISIQQMYLLGLDEFPFTGGQLVNAEPPANPALRSLRSVSGITVNTVHGNTESIAAVVERFAPQVESMEGAAFMYACLIHRVPFAQVRAVSNIVEKRNRSAWRLDEAIAALGAAAVEILDHA
jgi:futalosine hydrolase